ncbi:Golgi-associated plant pathogenesis-related protein 1-like [Haliotis cracherodii]|uniref:Golgi-associated plant pathogenesis-related protein 1-like n=1 Tax=Haliotis cracherodii TaxID=6455 RepID=UPI0039E81EFC
MGTFVDEVVQCHNLVRTKHGVKELKLNADLTAHAQKWADKLASSGKFEHSNCDFRGENVGENIAMAWKPGGQTLSGKEACDMWYSEISKYDYNKAGFSSGTGHFTQMVWKGSNELGVGIAKGDDGKIYVVANYLPPGNYTGQFQDNVFPPK